MNPLERVGAAVKSFRMRFGGNGGRWWWGMLGRSAVDYRAEAGDPLSNSIVGACVRWIQRNFPEAPIRVCTINRQGEDIPQPNHQLKLLVDTPNGFYPGELLWAATLADRTLDGNAYWIKIRNGDGRPIALWWAPSSMVEPKWPDDGSAFISHYEYTPGTDPIRLDPSDVVHFRYNSLDPQNPRKGLSPVKSLLREIFTDNEAADYTATMLRNVGVPPVVLQPKADKDGNLPKVTQEQADEAKSKFMERTTGSKRGEPIFMRGSTEITVLGFNPKDMDVRSLRWVAEERITANLGLQAAVVGLGTGLETTKVGATMTEMREQSWRENIIPTMRLMSAELRSQLLVDFGDVTRLKIDFDLSQVGVLQDDQNAKHARAREDLKAGMIMLDEARQEIGLEPLDGDQGKIFYLPSTVTATLPDELIPDPALAPPAPMPMLPPPGSAAGPDDNPPAKTLRLLKGSSATAEQRLQRLRTRLARSAERKVSQVLKEQQNAVLARLGARKDTREIINPDNVLPPDAERRLREALELVYLSALEGVHGVVEDVLGVTFELPDPLTVAYLAEAGVNITAIHEVTRRAIRESLQEGTILGESISQLAARIRDLPELSQRRGVLIARTELGQSSNRAAVHSYRASGVVVGVEIMDGDYDEACVARNGRRLALADAGSEPPLLHPNCTAAFAPITDAAELGAAA